MRIATALLDDHAELVAIRDGRAIALPPTDAAFTSMRSLAAAGAPAVERLRAWLGSVPAGAGEPLASVELDAAVPDPGAIYTIGENYASDVASAARPDRPLVYAKATASVGAPGAMLSWDRSLTANVDAEVELAVVIGREAWRVQASEAAGHVLGFTCIDDISSRDPWLDGDQWLLGKSMPGFCPVGPWVVTPDELDIRRLRLGCAINGTPIQDGSTADMRTPIAEAIAYLSRHVVLRPGDLIATGTPARLPGPLGPDRHLEAGDEVAAWIEGIGVLRTYVAG
jgi:2-keto-4-pentenoate hydratase/2-oxohepta-3-ene-1,7-dioic acid hydratase in catechol pathway